MNRTMIDLVPPSRRCWNRRRALVLTRLRATASEDPFDLELVKDEWGSIAVLGLVSSS